MILDAGWTGLARRYGADAAREVAARCEAAGDATTAQKLRAGAARIERRTRALRAAAIVALCVAGDLDAPAMRPRLAAMFRELPLDARRALASAFGLRARDLARELAHGAIATARARRACQTLARALDASEDDRVRMAAGAALAMRGEPLWRLAAVTG